MSTSGREGPQNGPRSSGVEPPPRRGALLPIAMAFAFGVVLFATLTIMSLGFAALVMGVALAVFGMIGMHYLIWGWWLSPMIHEHVDTREAESI